MDKEKMKGSTENELDDMEIFRLLDEVIEHGEEALPEMEDYLTATADSVDSPKVDVEASLKRFKTEHAEFFVKTAPSASLGVSHLCCSSSGIRCQYGMCVCTRP